ncbi:BglG family transcription antiterminator [uncultured Vagococcus sp.]|uniref:BglG family transcription antiterminator n=1 Tax=uncultured Vagococcus sp. TaxID=189676 RepID=UPI0028D2517D|nr:BglG family transcription antiterminator [uncultured Vagococcus sp.]
MKEKQRELLLFLVEKEQPFTSKQLSSYLGISQRTIKNYVKELNGHGPQLVIASSQQGYLAMKDPAMALFEEEQALTVPQDYMERAYYIIKKSLISHEKLSLFDLCEELHISYSTLKNLLTKMNGTFESFHLQFASTNNQLNIVGEEKDKRRLMSHIIYTETNNNFFNWNGLFQSYGETYIKHLSAIVKDVFKQNHYDINDFSFMSLILHLTILINRVRSGKYIEGETILKIEPKEKKIMEDLCHAIEATFEITLTPSEISEIYILFKTDVNLSLSQPTKDVKELVGGPLYHQAIVLIESVNQMYKINLMTDQFIIPFVLHLKRLKTRLKYHAYNKNPMIQSIKQSFPLIYEIAVYLSMQLEKESQIVIVEDEVAFIALHVGTEMERQQKNAEKIKCVLLCPDYMAISSRIESFLLANFSHDLHLVSAVRYQHQLASLDFDLLITTIDSEPTSQYKTFQISLFDVERSKSALYQVINQIKTQSKNNILKQNFDQYFQPAIFFVNPPFSTKEDLINQLSQEMVALDYVSDSFGTHVLEREQMSSTSYGQIAIPHSIHMDAIKTCVSVIIMTEGFLWDDTLVNIILLTAINDVDRRNFRIIYEAILELFEEKDIAQLASSLSTFQDFKQFVETNV